MTDKQRLAVLVQLANEVHTYSRIIKPEQYEKIGDFQSVVFNALHSFFECDLEENAAVIESEMEVAAVEYMFEEMEYFTEKYKQQEEK